MYGQRVGEHANDVYFFASARLERRGRSNYEIFVYSSGSHAGLLFVHGFGFLDTLGILNDSRLLLEV